VKTGAKRIWKSWKWGFIIALVLMVLVFIIGLNAEIGHKRTGFEDDEPLKFFSVNNINPPITAGLQTYTVSVNNNQQYLINSVSMTFQGITQTVMDDVTQSYSESVSSGGETSYAFEVLPGAEFVQITLNGDDPTPLSMTNIDLFCDGTSNSTTWESTGTDNDESITLGTADIQNGGYGSYSVRVSHESGLLSVDYQLTIVVSFGQLRMSQSSSEVLKNGDGLDFNFNVFIAEDELASVTFEIKAAVEIPGESIFQLERDYDSNWNVIREPDVIPAEAAGGEEPWGPVDTTGLMSIIAYTAAVVTGFIYLGRLIMFEATKPKWIGPIHCFVSLVSLLMAIDHTFIALQKDWPWFSAGMIFSYLAIINLFGFTVFSFYDVEGVKHFGKKKWRYLHLFLLIVLVLWVVLHVGFVGDHLGFLK